MKSWRRFYEREDIRGLAATPVMILLLLLAVAAVLVDFGHTLMVRRQMQQAAEAGAVAGARALAYGTTLNFSMAVGMAIAAMREKSVDGKELGDFDGNLQKIQVGYWDLSWTRDTAPANLNGYEDPAHYSPSANEVPAVKVNITMTSGSRGRRAQLSAYFASFMGFGHVEVATFAVAIRPGGRAHVYGVNLSETRLVD